MVVLGIHCCMGFSLVATSRDYSVVAVGRTLISAASLNAEHGLSAMQPSVVVVCGSFMQLLALKGTSQVAQW